MLVAQVFPEWLEDMKESGISDTTSDKDVSEQLSHLQNFLLSAAFHIQNRSDSAQFGGHSSFEPGIGQELPKLRNGVFSRQKFLGIACKTGRGLP